MNRPTSKTRSQELTRAELEIMQILWEKGHALVHDIRDAMPEPRPAYNTVSTVVRILETKGFVGHTPYGRTHEYHPLTSREEYTDRYMTGVLGNFFGGSPVQMVSFLSKRENISTKELDSIIEILEELKNESK
ncbi:MAG: BlaI/MecI/CopY family transcriptional regulator [Alistipes sp.]|jgi:predicted transcriptional regulator|nr:BlaI/MecI/CopY family transcriptional regulator [Alistipes sp.]